MFMTVDEQFLKECGDVHSGEYGPDTNWSVHHNGQRCTKWLSRADANSYLVHRAEWLRQRGGVEVISGTHAISYIGTDGKCHMLEAYAS